MSFSPRGLQSLFLAVTLLVGAVLGWLGWRLLQQDRALARQRRLEQLEAAAERVTSALYRRLAELEEALADPGHARIPAGAVLVRMRLDAIEVRPPDGLLYYPVVSAAPEPPPATFADGDALEFRRSDPAGAAAAARPLARSANPAVRAAALVRLGRNLKKSRRTAEAFQVYEELAAMGTAQFRGLPAELVALEARCSLFEELGRRSDLEREARVLYQSLANSRWRLLQASFDYQVEQARAWLGNPPEPPQWNDKAALSGAALFLYGEWLREPAGKGRRVLAMDGYPVLAAWTSSTQELIALIAPAAAVGSALREAGSFRAMLTDAEGHLVLGQAGPPGAVRVERTPATSKLPWTLEVAALDDGSAETAGRRWILTGGMALLLGLLASVSYVVARATTRELAVARRQRDFVSAVSHEFRSPLSSICQMTELLNEDRWPSDEHRRRGYSILARESARLRRLVEGLLDFARMEAGAVRYRLEPLAPEELVRHVVEEFRAQSPSPPFEVQFSAASELPATRADREALGRALWNLLDNAVKYSPNPARVFTDVSMEDGRLAIRVRDEGLGISPAEQKKIFRKFVRGSQAEAGGMRGTGIGLAMVRHIVEGHAGVVKLESEPGRGSTFTILLPAERSA